MPAFPSCHKLFPGAVLMLAVLAGGCDEALSTLAGPSPNLQPTFSSIQSEVFEKTDAAGRAACTQCHTDAGRNPSSGLNLRREVAYANLVGAASRSKAGAVRVIPGDAEHSYLIHKLEGSHEIVGERMPRTGGPYLTAGQIAIIKRWIDAGAKND